MSSIENKGRSGAVRQKLLRWVDLAKMEKHGRRDDISSQRRKVRDESPLYFGGSDLKDLRNAHMQGVKTSSKGACIHAIVQFPSKLIDGCDPGQQFNMLVHARKFLNEYHGGDAVFAARLDRDEAGRHTVDVFLMPRYDYHYKDGRILKKHRFQSSRRRRPSGAMADDRRAQGSALQDAWYEYMRAEMGLDVRRPERKKAFAADRVEPEVYGLKQDQAAHAKAVEAERGRIKKAWMRISRTKRRNDEVAQELQLQSVALEKERRSLRDVMSSFAELAGKRGELAKVRAVENLMKFLKPRENQKIK
ncbi:hypothetical protein ACFSYD_27040 [Paracoccus aerius]